MRTESVATAALALSMAICPGMRLWVMLMATTQAQKTLLTWPGVATSCLIRYVPKPNPMAKDIKVQNWTNPLRPPSTRDTVLQFLTTRSDTVSTCRISSDSALKALTVGMDETAFSTWSAIWANKSWSCRFQTRSGRSEKMTVPQMTGNMVTTASVSCQQAWSAIPRAARIETRYWTWLARVAVVPILISSV